MKDELLAIRRIREHIGNESIQWGIGLYIIDTMVESIVNSVENNKQGVMYGCSGDYLGCKCSGDDGCQCGDELNRKNNITNN